MLCMEYILSRDDRRLLSSNRQQITITGIRNGHDARQVVSETRCAGRRRQLTQLGKASRQRFPEPRSYQRNGEQRSWTTWHSTPTQTSSVGDSSQRSARAWLQIATGQFKGPSQPHAPVPVERVEESVLHLCHFASASERTCIRESTFPT